MSSHFPAKQIAVAVFIDTSEPRRRMIVQERAL